MQQVYRFLTQLSNNNNKNWFHEHKAEYEQAKLTVGKLFDAMHQSINPLDEIEPIKKYRIYNDIRFAKNKPLYKDNFGAIIKRIQPYNRGSFYINIAPQNNFIAAGFCGPYSEDLLAIRKAFVYEDQIVHLQNDKTFQHYFGQIQGDGVKTAPKGFDKNHERIEFIKKKQFILMHPIQQEDIISGKIIEDLPKIYEAALPFFKYMTDILITDANGEIIIK